jgi:hypothetical protein
MVGRAAYHDPWRLLAGADVALWGADTNPCGSRREAFALYSDYAAVAATNRQITGYVPSTRTLMAPLLGMTHGVRGGRKWRAAVDAALRQQRRGALAADTGSAVCVGRSRSGCAEAQRAARVLSRSLTRAIRGRLRIPG